MRYLLTILAICLLVPVCARAEYRPQVGDILLQDIDGPRMCEAIERLQPGKDGMRFSHAAFICRLAGDGTPWILETGAKVQETPLPAFLDHAMGADGKSRTVVARLQPEYRKIIPEAVKRGQDLLGQPYDGEFVHDNGKWYCSELVQEAFRDTEGRFLFPDAPMTWQSDDPWVAQFWQLYFERIVGHPAPEGAPGTSPGRISASDKVELIFPWGRPGVL